MQDITVNAPAWQQTAPIRVTPKPFEWLAGLLLRCDEINHWACRTTLTHLLSPGPEKFHRCWRTQTPHLVVIQPYSLDLDSLSQLLAIAKNTLLATTYHLELARLYETTHVHPKLLSETFVFRLCPQCIAEARLITRTLTLPHVTICPQHRLLLVSQCQCGTSLRLFHRDAPPFTCHMCRLDWADLPGSPASSAELAQEQKFLKWYAFFFSKEAPPLTRKTLFRLSGSLLKRSLGELVALLVERRYAPYDLFGRLSLQDGDDNLL